VVETLQRPRTWFAGALALAVLAAVAAVVLTRGGGGPRYPVVDLAPTDHEVLYEINGTGVLPALTWIVGDDNQEQTALNVPLPFRQTVTIPVGPAGGHANIEARSPGTGAGSLSCTMFVDGVQVAQQVSTDGFAGVACSALIPPTYVK
jgi:hypothetical protein